MDMEKIFRPNKWFVYFCALLVVIWLILQAVALTRIVEESKLVARQILTWHWTGIDYDSNISDMQAKIIKKTDNDAVVEINGKQVLTRLNAGDPTDGSSGKTEIVDCSAVLTFYKASNSWVLGKVELR